MNKQQKEIAIVVGGIIAFAILYLIAKKFLGPPFFP